MINKASLSDIVCHTKDIRTIGYARKHPIILESSFICMNIFDIEKNIDLLISKSSKDIQFNHIHVDVMDNAYVPRYGMYPQIVEQIQQKYENRVHFHTHIMANSTRETIQYFAKYSDIVYFHLNSCNHPSSMIDIIHDYEAKAGIVVDRHNFISDILPIRDFIDAIMIMGINPGVLKNIEYPGLDRKISQCQDMFPDKIIAVDGGVTMDTIDNFANRGVTNLTCGSRTLYNNTPLETNIETIITKLQT